jgi:exodeoxyribonuclease VII large subunit
VDTTARGERLPGLLPGERTDALSIGALYGRVQAVLGRAFARGHPLWVRGEIQSISDRTGHCYMELVDPDGGHTRDAPVLKVTFWSRNWTPVKAALMRQGIGLEPGLVVTLQGRVEVYAPRAQMTFVAVDLDVNALLGRIAASRAALLKALDSEALLHRNKSLPVPEVPMVVGLVASQGTEGFRDFIGQLKGSGSGFHVLHAPVQVQGVAAPRQIAAALSGLSVSGCDLLVVVRGGGSKADLSAFDSEPVARAIAQSAIPVWTGIGHTGDQSVADVVANRAFVTPTECGAEIVARVSDWWALRAASAAEVAKRATQAVSDALRRDSESRARLCSSARNQLSRHSERLDMRARRLLAAGPRAADGVAEALRGCSERLERATMARIAEQEQRLVSWRRLIAAYDVERQLERGYTLTLDPEGRILRSVDELAPGSAIVTRFADGSARSEVTDVAPQTEDTR